MIIPYSEEWYDEKISIILNDHKLTLPRRLNLYGLLRSIFSSNKKGDIKPYSPDIHTKGEINIDMNGFDLIVSYHTHDRIQAGSYILKFCPKCNITFENVHPDFDAEIGECELGLIDRILNT